jgi:hypothetical protein
MARRALKMYSLIDLLREQRRVEGCGGERLFGDQRQLELHEDDQIDGDD